MSLQSVIGLFSTEESCSFRVAFSRGMLSPSHLAVSVGLAQSDLTVFSFVDVSVLSWLVAREMEGMASRSDCSLLTVKSCVFDHCLF